MSSGFLVGIECFGDCPGGLQCSVEAFGQDRTMVDCDQVVRASRGEADLEHIVGATAGVKYRAAPAFAMRVDQLGDRRVEPGLAQSRNDKIALPGPIVGSCPNAARRNRRTRRNAGKSA